MAKVFFLSFAVISAIAISVCGGIPYARNKASGERMIMEQVGKSLEVPRWLRDSFRFLRKSIPEVDIENGNNKIYSHQSHQKDNEEPITKLWSTLPVLLHKKDEINGIKLSPSTTSTADKSFIRSKRSTCAIPANLPELVRALNSRLRPNQLVGLIPEAPYRKPIPSGQPSQCHDEATNKWWPRTEINLRSTCPWNIIEVDLGENAFPRYINKAVCLCMDCIGSFGMRCEETRQTVSYLYSQGCQDGLAVMERRNTTVTVGCHCAAAPRDSARPGRITL